MLLTQSRPESPTTQLARQLRVSVSELRTWAAQIAHRVRRSYHFSTHSTETDDLLAEADRALCERCNHFDTTLVPPGGNLLHAFKGYAHDWIRDAVRKEAERLRSGGTFHTVRPQNRPPHVTSLGESASELPSLNTPHNTEPLSRVKINGIPYAIPFENLFRPLSSAEAETLEASITLNGVLVAPITCTLPTIGPAIIDGANRCAIADRLGLPVPVPADLGELTHTEAAEKASELNVARRQLTRAESEAAQTQLLNRITVARASGKSLRAIAREQGLKHAAQVLRMLRAAGYLNESAVTPATVTGDDGRNQPAHKPPATTASLAASAGRALDTAFRKLGELLRLDRHQIIALADDCDIPFTTTTPGHEDWPALTTLTVLRGLLGRIG